MTPNWAVYAIVVVMELVGFALVLFASGFAVWGGLRDVRKPHRALRFGVTIFGQFVLVLLLWWHIAHFEQLNLTGWVRVLLWINMVILAASPILTVLILYTIWRDKTPTRPLFW